MKNGRRVLQFSKGAFKYASKCASKCPGEIKLAATRYELMICGVVLQSPRRQRFPPKLPMWVGRSAKEDGAGTKSHHEGRCDSSRGA